MVSIIISDELNHRIKNVISGEKEEFQEIFNKLFNVELDGESKEYRNYFGIARDNHNMISYLDSKKMDILDYSDYWNADKRIMATAGKVVRKLLPDVNDKDLERFVQLYTFQNKQCYECIDTSIIKIVKGEDIRTYYLEDNYSNYAKQEGGNNSQIFSSCMRYSNTQDYLDIYTMNKNQVSLAVILTESEKVKSRCLLWHKDDITYYDRIYAVNNEVNLLMQNCLEKLGYINISNKNIIKSNFRKTLTIRLDYGQYDLDCFPYADTMNCLDGKYLSNCGECNMQETDGELTSEETYYCPYCEEDHSSDEDFRQIDRGGRRGEYVCENCWVIDYNNDCILDDDSVNTYYDDVCHEDDVIRLHNGRDCHQDNAVELYNGDYAYKDDDILEDYEGNKFLSGDDNFTYVEQEDEWYPVDMVEYDEKENTYKLIQNV